MNDSHSAEMDIRAARARQTRAMAEGDLDMVAAFWTEDVTMRRALGQAVAGRAEYRAMLVAAGAAAVPLVYQRAPDTVEVSLQWPLAYEEGRWSGHAGSAGGPAVMSGRYAAQWVKREGRWLIRAEVFVALTCAGEGGGLEAVP